MLLLKAVTDLGTKFIPSFLAVHGGGLPSQQLSDLLHQHQPLRALQHQSLLHQTIAAKQRANQPLHCRCLLAKQLQRCQQ
jgi:hypothetical protein